MAVIPRKTAAGLVYQVRIQDSEGKWIGGGVFESKREADEANQKLRRTKRKLSLSSLSRKVTVSDYFSVWFEATDGGKASPGWRERQSQMFRDYVEPVIGKIKPSVIQKEAEFLKIDEVQKLAEHVEGKPYELAVWLQLLIGPRVGEVQALLWKNVDFENGIIHIRRTFVRNESKGGNLTFKEYPKGKHWQDIPIPPELLVKLHEAKAKSVSEFVAVSQKGDFLEYSKYFRALKKYCLGAKIKSIATHGLRYSTAEVWMKHGAGRDDIRAMFAHSSSDVTDRYIHRQASKQLERFSNVVRLFPESSRKSSHASEIDSVTDESKKNLFQ